MSVTHTELQDLVRRGLSNNVAKVALARKLFLCSCGHSCAAGVEFEESFLALE